MASVESNDQYIEAATGAGVIVAPSNHAVTVTTSKDGKRKYDTTEIPSLLPEDCVWEQWTCSKLGNLYQMEGTITNHGDALLKGMRMDIEPPNCIHTLWNLKHIPDTTETHSVGLAGYWVDPAVSGGVPPGETFRWGGIFTADSYKATFRPHKPME